MYDLKEFIEENCLICGSHNYLRIQEGADAWTCWNCNSNWWIDEYSKSIFLLQNYIDPDFADVLLLQSSPIITFINGQIERD